jgi:hypothetical protein
MEEAMSPSFKNPLEGYPQTIETKGTDGLPLFRIRLRTLSPERAKRAHEAADGAWLFFAVLVAAALYVGRAHVGLVVCIGAFVLVMVAEHFLPRIADNVFCEHTEIVMSPKAITVRSGRSQVQYKRLLKHCFALKEHDLTAWEQRAIEYRIRDASLRNNKAINPTVYYGQSAHVVLVYAGHRQDLLTVWGITIASAIVERLQYCDDCLNKALSMGGSAHTPGDQWPEGPGGIE